jgi:hypothetical protein
MRIQSICFLLVPLLPKTTMREKMGIRSENSALTPISPMRGKSALTLIVVVDKPRLIAPESRSNFEEKQKKSQLCEGRSDAQV